MAMINPAVYVLYQIPRSMKRFVFTPYFGARKFINAGMVFIQYGIFKNSNVKGYPLKINFDPTSICQLACPLCPTGQGKGGRSLGRADVGKFKQLIDEVAPYLYEIDFNNWGEPFLNKDLPKMIKYAHDNNIRTSVNTNLSLVLSEETAEGVVKSGLDQLYCSIDGITQEVYEKYRVRGNLEMIKNNIKLIDKKKKELGSKTPKIVWQFLSI